jgi:hypothetical protein
VKPAEFNRGRALAIAILRRLKPIETPTKVGNEHGTADRKGVRRLKNRQAVYLGTDKNWLHGVVYKDFLHNLKDIF